MVFKDKSGNLIGKVKLVGSNIPKKGIVSLEKENIEYKSYMNLHDIIVKNI